MAGAVSPLAALAAAASHLAVAARAPAVAETAVGATVVRSSVFPSPLVLLVVVPVWNTSRTFTVAPELCHLRARCLGMGCGWLQLARFPLRPQCFCCREDGVLDDHRSFICSQELLVGQLLIADVGPLLLMEWDAE